MFLYATSCQRASRPHHVHNELYKLTNYVLGRDAISPKHHMPQATRHHMASRPASCTYNASKAYNQGHIMIKFGLVNVLIRE
jgi:hypothetical protein